MIYEKWFDPAKPARGLENNTSVAGDRSAVSYVYDADTVLAVNVALATQRPLLVSGPSGCGKSSLAADVARVLAWDYLPFTVTSRIQAGDLLYSIDHIQRLRDAQQDKLDATFRRYIKPGILWKAFDTEGAGKVRGTSPEAKGVGREKLSRPEPNQGVVVLLDEIDKAEPDVPNDLLLPLGSYVFRVPELKTAEVRALRVPMIVLTTNNERKLPDAFVRRCVDLKLKAPTIDTLVTIGQKHLSVLATAYNKAHTDVTDLFREVAEQVQAAIGASYRTSTAEYLDTVRAIVSLNIPKGDWSQLPAFTIQKPSHARTVAE